VHYQAVLVQVPAVLTLVLLPAVPLVRVRFVSTVTVVLVS
jgi:hypothetical protein